MPSIIPLFFSTTPLNCGDKFMFLKVRESTMVLVTCVTSPLIPSPELIPNELMFVAIWFLTTSLTLVLGLPELVTVVLSINCFPESRVFIKVAAVPRGFKIGI